MHAAEPNAEFILQLVLGRVRHEFLIELVAEFVRNRVNVADKVFVSLSRRFILGIASHGDIASTRNFRKYRTQFAPFQNPRAQGIGGVGNIFVKQSLIKRLDIFYIVYIEIFRYKSSFSHWSKS